MKTVKKVGQVLGIFVTSFLLLFIYFTYFCGMFYRMECISDITMTALVLSFSIIFAIITTICLMYVFTSSSKTRLGNWLNNNFARIALFFILSTMFFVAVRPELIWEYDEMKEIVELEWTIFGLSITIFLVWDVLVLNHLKNTHPDIKNDSMLNISQNNRVKQNYYRNVSYTFNDVIMLTINLFTLVLSTSLLYMDSREATVHIQTVIMFCFCICVNSLISVFLSLLSPLYNEKINMLKDMKVTNDDIDAENNLDDNIESALLFLDILDELDLDSKQKLLAKTKVLSKFMSTQQRQLISTTVDRALKQLGDEYDQL